MTKGTLVFFLGVLLIVVPYLGIPQWWKQSLYVGFGIILLLVGYLLHRMQYLNDIDRGNGERGGETFVESTPPLFSDPAAE